MYQYDKSPLTIAGECQPINNRIISTVFVVVDVQEQFPLLGRDWMALIIFDLISLMRQATAIYQMTADVVKNDLIGKVAEVFWDELGIWKEIEATVTVNESATPCFHKAHLVPFALKEKVEKQVHQQVQEGELVPVDRSDCVSLYTRRTGASGFVVTLRYLSILSCNLRHIFCPVRRCLVHWPMVSLTLNLT